MEKIDNIGCSVAVGLLKVLNGGIRFTNRLLLAIASRGWKR